MSVVVYFSGDAEKARAFAPEGAAPPVRFANAKWFSGEAEIVKTRARTTGEGGGIVPVMFDHVILTPGCQNADEIRSAYKALGVEVEEVSGGKKKAKPKAVKVSAKELGWDMKTSPEKYLERYPKGAKAPPAAEILEKMKG